MAKPKEGDQSFLPLYTRGLIPGARLSFPLFLKTIEEGSSNIQYILICDIDTIFPEEWFAKLRQLDIDKLYFAREDLGRVIDYLDNHLTLLENEENAPTQKKLRIFYDHLNLTLHFNLRQPLIKANVAQAIRAGEKFLLELQDKEMPLHMLWETMITEYGLYQHSLNVFLLSLAFMRFLNRVPEDLKSLGIAALFHDIGLIKINNSILEKKPVLLSPEERSQLEHHPLTGFHLLKEYPAIPLGALRLIREHHENLNGTGYPEKLKPQKQHPDSRILRLVDEFVSLTSKYLYRSAYDPFTALKILQAQASRANHLFDRQILEKFIKFLNA